MSQSPTALAAKRPRLSAENWIAEALEVMVDKSIDNVKVDILAARLKMTRGSFYHHFIDRADLLKRLLLHWKHRQTEQVIARFRGLATTAQELIREHAELPFHGKAAQRGAAVELAIRAWARRDNMARDVVEEVDSLRTQFLGRCFEELGFNSSEAKTRAWVLYCYMQSESIFRTPGSAAEQAKRRSLVVASLTRVGS